MSNQFSFRCSKCSKIHEGIPSFSFEAPTHYYDVPEEEREARTFLTSESCVIDNELYFAKGFLEFQVKGLFETLTFTPWVSLSESNFLKFEESLEVSDASHFGRMFGWLCTQMDDFGECDGIKTNLIFQDSNNRPFIEIQESDHPLYKAYKEGISQEFLVTIVEGYLHRWSD